MTGKGRSDILRKVLFFPPAYLSADHTMHSILVIEDNMEERELFMQILEKAGYDVCGANDGNIGLEMFRRQPFDLVVSDIYMPDKEGLETIFELKTDFPDVRVIAVTGGMTWTHHDDGIDNILKIAKAVGADIDLMKPVMKHEFLDAVKGMLEDAA